MMTENNYKPEGYNSVSVYLTVRGAQKMIDFLKEVFDAEELRRYDNQDGSIIHAEVRIDDTVVMIGDAPPDMPPRKQIIHVYVPDVDAAFNRAIAAGATVDKEPIQMEGDPDKRGSFIDFAGNHWAVGTQQN